MNERKYLNKFLDQKIDVYVKESTAWFSGRDYEMMDEINRYNNFSLELNQVSNEGIEGVLEDGSNTIVRFFERCEKQLTSELVEKIQSYKVCEKKIIAIKKGEEVLYENGR